MISDLQLDKIFIKDFRLRVTIGIDEEERATQTDVLVNITMWTDTQRATQTNNLVDAIDYRQTHQQILSFAQSRPFILIEHFAQELAVLVLQHPLIQKVQITVEKPYILKHIKSAGIEIIRQK